ncbi:MAG: DUF5693 family protein [bacterium]|nr:DUF5693 family protein [bacterium]
MRKNIILNLSLLVITLLFYGYRLDIEVRSKNTAFLLEYNAFLNYWQKENIPVSDFIKKMKDTGINNVLVYPATLSNLLNEYNDILLIKGGNLNLLGHRSVFHPEAVYLMVPSRLKDIQLKLKYRTKVFQSGAYKVFEFFRSTAFISDIPVSYLHSYEKTLSREGITIIRAKNEPLLKNIDEFFDTGRNRFIGSPGRGNGLLKIHLFQKRINVREDEKVFIQENFRAVLERRVNSILIHALQRQNQLVGLFTVIDPLKQKLERKGYHLQTIQELVPVMDDWIIRSHRCLLVILTLCFIFFRFRPLFKYSLTVSLILVLLDPRLFYLVILTAGFYGLNEYIITRYGQRKFSYKELGLSLVSLFLLGLVVSNYLFDPLTSADPRQVPAVKLAFLIPFLLFLVQYKRFNKLTWRSVFKAKITLMEYCFYSLFASCIVFLLLRSGNYALPVPLFEISIRNALETLFFIRPRFKEIIFYQFLFYPVLLRSRQDVRNNFFPLYMLALVGMASTLNSFLHVPALSYYTVMRSVLGILAGGIFSLALTGMVRSRSYGPKNIH